MVPGGSGGESAPRGLHRPLIFVRGQYHRVTLHCMLVILRFARFGVGEGEDIEVRDLWGMRPSTGTVKSSGEGEAQRQGNTSMCRDHDVFALQLC